METIQRIKRDIRANRNQSKEREQENTAWATLTYIGRSTYKLAKFFRKHNIKLAYRTNNNLGKILKNNTNETDILDRQGVYKLTCTCQYSYIGQTGRKIKTRFREHIREHNKRHRAPSSTPE